MARWQLAIAAAALGVGLAVELLAGGDGGPDSPVSATPFPPGGEPVPSADPLWETRINAASPRRFNVDPLEMRLVELRHAGWDGCLGVNGPGRGCSELFVGGYVAVFEVQGKQAIYHIGGSEWIGPVAPDKAQVDDGSPVPPELRADFNGILASYVRQELALRRGVTEGDVTVLSIVPATFADGCLGYSVVPIGSSEPCATTAGPVPGAFVALELGRDEYDYNVGTRGVVLVDTAKGRRTQGPVADVAAVQLRMREDLAGRLKLPLGRVSVASYRDVTWPDGCLGVSKPGDVCAQALVPGFLARLEADGKQYEYHGAGGSFVAAFGVTVTGPIFGP
jgi:hypothetical protein